MPVSKLVYSSTQITQIMQMLNTVKVEGIANIKLLASLALILENPIETATDEETSNVK